MRNNYALKGYQNSGFGLSSLGLSLPRKAVVGIILLVALFSFEIFNFDTTRYALRDLMGDVRFLGFQWASILAIAFCSIDFAGLVRLFTPEKGKDEPKEVWYLMGAWLLGATMNALMTWWAVSLTLLNHDFGNEVLSREQLLNVVPIFVAVLVWLTRILFIGAFTVAGEHVFDFSSERTGDSASADQPQPQPVRSQPVRMTSNKPQRTVHGRVPQTSNDVPGFLNSYQPAEPTANQPSQQLPIPPDVKPRRQPNNSRIRQRPPMPSGVRRVPFNGVQAKSRNRN